MKTVVTWQGRLLTDLTREELLVAAEDFARMLEREREAHKGNLKMADLFVATALEQRRRNPPE